MSVWTLVSLCAVILTATQNLDPLLHALGYERAPAFMFCLSALTLGAFSVSLSPEVSVQPGMIVCLLFLTCSAAHRRELRALNLLLSILTLTPTILLAAYLSHGNMWITTQVGLVAAAICGIRRPALGLLAAGLSAFTAYYLSMLLSTGVVGGVYGVFEARDLENTAALMFSELFLLYSAFAYSAARVKHRAV